jgi:hypothetical protein
VSGRISELLKRDARRSEITLSGNFEPAKASLAGEGASLREVGGMLLVLVEGAERQKDVLRRALELGLAIEQVVPRHETLEDLFLREAIAGGERPRD